MYKFKEKFLEHYGKLTNIKEFCEYCIKPLNKSIRVNTLKITINELKNKLHNYRLTQVPWCKEGFWIKGPRTDLGNLIEHSLGYFYVQEAASMIPPIILDPKEDDLVLDLAAAPGSKTTQIASLMKNHGLIIANDIKYDRLKALSINLERCGILNTIVTLRSNYSFNEIKFDKILLDAPCSGSGAIRKSLRTLEMWNPNMLINLSGTQKKLILNAFDFLLRNRDCKIEKINLDIKTSPVILDYGKEHFNKEIKKCLRIWPQDNDTEGFFVAKIKKG